MYPFLVQYPKVDDQLLENYLMFNYANHAISYKRYKTESLYLKIV